ncbi:hypothetical protein, partial [Winslowiella iniecta]
MTIQQAAANTSTSRYQMQTEASRQDSGYPSVPPVAFANLVNAVAAARVGGQEWTQDESIGELAARCFRLSPPLMNWLNREIGLALSTPQAGSPVTLTAMTGKADLTEHEAGMLAGKLEECFLFGLEQPAVDEPLDHAGQGMSGGLKPLEKQLITDRLAVLDEYDREKSNPTLYTRHTLADEWLKMKDVVLIGHAGPLPEAAVENHVMAVPPAILYLVEEAQQGIRVLEEGFRREWTGKLEEGVSDYLAGRVQATVEATGQALAESMTALRAAARPEMAEAARYAQQESGVLKMMARDVMNLLGPGAVMKLLDKPAIKEMETFLSSLDENDPGAEEKPETEHKLREKMTEMLAGQLKAAAEKNPQLAKGLKVITEKSVKEYQKKNRSSLALAACNLQHAIDKSARLRSSLKTAMNQQLRADSVNLMATLEGSERTLKKAFAEIEHFRPGMLENLNTLGTLAQRMINDSSMGNYFSKKLQGLKNAASSTGTAVNGMRKKLDAILYRKIDKHFPVSGDITPAQKTELSTLMISLDNAADQIRSVARPLQDAAERLQRVLKRDNNTAMDSDRLIQLAAIKARQPVSDTEKKAGTVLGVALDIALGNESNLVRLEEKVQKTQDEFSALTAEVRKTLPYLKEQFAVELGLAIEEMRRSFSGHPRATEYIQLTEGMAQAFSIRLDKLEKKIDEAEKTGSKDLEQAASRMAAVAKEMAGEAEVLSQNIRLITAKELGAEYGYNHYEKNMVRNLIDLVDELSNDDPEKEKETLKYLVSTLSAGDRTVLRRENDPGNSVLLAGMRQELFNILNEVQRRPPTAKDLVAQTIPIKDQLLKKATEKTVSGVVSTAMSAMVGADLIADITRNAARTITGSRLVRPGNLLRSTQLYDGYKGLDGVRKATQPSQRPQDYLHGKMADRAAAGFGLSLLSLALPGPIALPVTLIPTVINALKNPKKFLDTVAGVLPMEVAFTSIYESARTAINTAAAALNAAENHDTAGKNQARKAAPDRLSAQLQSDLAQHLQERNEEVQEENEPKRAKKTKRSIGYLLPDSQESELFFNSERRRILQQDKNLTPLQVESAIVDYKSAVSKYRELNKKSAPVHELDAAKRNLFKAADTLEIIRNNLEEREKIRASLPEEQLTSQAGDYFKSIQKGYNIRSGDNLSPLKYARNYLSNIINGFKKEDRGGIDSPDTEIMLISERDLSEHKFTLLDIATGKIDTGKYRFPRNFVEKHPTSVSLLVKLKLITITPGSELYTVYNKNAPGIKIVFGPGPGFMIRSLGDDMLKRYELEINALRSDAASVNAMDNFYESNFKITAAELEKAPELKAFRALLEDFRYGKREAQHLVLDGSTLSEVICFSIKSESGTDKILAMDINGSHIVIENTQQGLKNVENQKWIVSHLNGSKQYQYRDDARRAGAFQYRERSTAPLDNLVATSSMAKKYSRPYSPLTTRELTDTGKETFSVVCQRSTEDMNAMIKTYAEYLVDSFIDFSSLFAGMAISAGLASVGLSPAVLFLVQLAASAGTTVAKELLKAALKDNRAEVENILRSLPEGVLAGMITDTGITLGAGLAAKVAKSAKLTMMFESPAREGLRDFAVTYGGAAASNEIANAMSSNSDSGSVNTQSELKIIPLAKLPKSDTLDTSSKGVVIGNVYIVSKPVGIFDICRDLGISVEKFVGLELANEDRITDSMNIKANTVLVIPDSVLEESRFSSRKGESSPGKIKGNEYVVSTNTNLNAISRSLNIEPQQVYLICLLNGIVDPNNIPSDSKLIIPDIIMQQYPLQISESTASIPDTAPPLKEFKTQFGQIKGNELIILKSASNYMISNDLKLSLDSDLSPSERIERHRLLKELRAANPNFKATWTFTVGTKLTLPDTVLQYYLQKTGQNAAGNADTAAQQNIGPFVAENINTQPQPQPQP